MNKKTIKYIFFFFMLLVFFTNISTTHAVETINDDFETTEANWAGWTNVSGDSVFGNYGNQYDKDWEIREGRTPSYYTGPNQASTGDQYIYLEASGSNNKTVFLETIDLEEGIFINSVEFDYHMYGRNMGTLDLEYYDGIDETDGHWISVWNQTGQKQNRDIAPWEKVYINLSSYQTTKVRFKGITGKTYTSDIALDNITLTTISDDNPLPIRLTEHNRLKGYVATQDIYLNNYKILNEPDSASLAITSEKVEISKAMKLKPMSDAPDNPSMGDIYVNTSNALCVYLDGKWNKVAGTGTCERDLTAPVLLTIVVSPDGETIVLTYDEVLDDSVLPSNNSFSILGSSGVLINVTGVDIDGSTVTLSLDHIINGDETVTLTYAAGANPIQDSAGNDAALIDETQSITNSSEQDTIAPVLQTVVVPAAGTTIELTYDENLDTSSIPANSGFIISGSALSASVSTVTIAYNKVTLTLDKNIFKDETITLTYIVPVTGPIQDDAGNDAALIDETQSVTNNSTVSGIISGIVMAGYVNGATVKAYKINPDGTKGDQIGDDATSANGSYSITNTDYTGAILLEASEGTYTDEATGIDTTLTTLTAIAYIDTLTATISITPLTHIAAQLMDKAAADITTEISNKNELVAEQFGLMQTIDNANPIDIISVQPDDITDPTVIGKPLDDKKLYALVLAGISQNQENDSTGNIDTLDDIITEFSTDLDSNSKLSEEYKISFSAGVSGYVEEQGIKIIDNDQISIDNPIIKNVIKGDLTGSFFPEANIQFPEANIRDEKKVILEKGGVVTFDGLTSEDYNNNTGTIADLKYEWILIKPDGSTATLSLSSTDDNTATLQSGAEDEAGVEYTITLKVIDKTNTEYFDVESITITTVPFDCTMGVTIPTTINENVTYDFGSPSFSGTDNPTGAWTYTINPTTAPFLVDPSTGIITMAPVDYEAGITTYDVTLIATDEASPANVINKALSITITNVVDITPVLDAPAEFTVAEDAAEGDVLGSLTISVNDSDTSGTTIALSGTGYENFEVINDSGTWNIKVKAGASLDYETTQTYSLTATASNGIAGTGNEVDVTINVTNVMDTTPSLTDPQPSSPYTVSEDATTGTIVGELIISANDSDALSTAITLTGTGSGNFEVINDSGTWNIKVKAGASLDYETITSYTLKAQATNTAGTGNEVEVTINVTNAAEITGITGPDDLTYFPGASLSFIVSYDADVTVDDASGSSKPAINLHIGSTALASKGLGFIDTGKAEYSSALTTEYRTNTSITNKDIVFEYIVGNTDDHTDIDGIEITDLSIKLNSGTIKDASNNDASLDLSNITMPGFTNVLLDARMWNIMTNAGFIYIPSWDVDSDGTKEPGFWMAKYEAKATSTPITLPNKTLRAYMSENFNVYNPTTKYFDQILCSDGLTGAHSGTTPTVNPGSDLENQPPGSGRQNSFSTALLNTFVGNTPGTFVGGDTNTYPKGFDNLNKVEFVKENSPIGGKNAVEAALMITDSQITDGEDIKLPTNMQWQQVVSLIFNNKANWTGVGNPSTNGNDPILNSADWGSDTLGFSSVIYKGYTDETNPPGKAADIDANGYTGVESYEKKRRTFVIANNISVRDRNNTIDIADDESVQVNDPAVASNYAAVIWDFSGNVSEWTRGLVAAKTETSYDGTVDGGDRFDTGDNESTEFDNVLHMAEGDGYLMPNWLEPVFAYDGDRIKSSKNLGKYNDGDNQAGSWCSHSQQGATPFNPSIGPINFGYGEGNEDAPLGGFSAVYRGGSYLVALDEASGLNTLSTASSPSFRFEHIGFRAASYTQKGTKGI